MPTATLEELSNQHRRKIGDGTEMKETELDKLQRQRNKGAKDSESIVTLGMNLSSGISYESGGRGSVPGALLKHTAEKYP